MDMNHAPVAVAITVSADRLHPATDRRTAPHLNRSKLFQALLFCSNKDTHRTSHNRHIRCTILAPPWFKDRATTLRPTHSRGNPFLSPFLLPNLS